MNIHENFIAFVWWIKMFVCDRNAKLIFDLEESGSFRLASLSFRFILSFSNAYFSSNFATYLLSTINIYVFHIIIFFLFVKNCTYHSYLDLIVAKYLTWYWFECLIIRAYIQRLPTIIIMMIIVAAAVVASIFDI